VLLKGEVGYETDTKKTKRGDGVTAWNSLPYDAPNATILSSTYAPAGGVGFVAKPLGDGRSGVVDLTNDDTTGYLFHLHTGANSGGGSAAIGIGTDKGLGTGLLISHKNGGAGQSVVQNPGAGYGLYSQGYAATAVHRTDIYAGSFGMSWNLATGAGFADGVSTSRALNDPTGCIPSAVTITYVNATTVTMSVPAAATGTGVLFRVAGRPIPDLQSILKVFASDGTTVIGSITDAGLDWRAGNILRPAGKFRAKAGQTSSIFEITDSANVVLSRFGPAGQIMTRKNVAPADGDLATGEMAFWFDSTNGAAKLMVKAKQADGTVKTASLALA
jgi:hypothetical protein